MRLKSNSVVTLLQMVVRTGAPAFKCPTKCMLQCRHFSSKVKEILSKTDRLHDHDDHTETETTFKAIMRKVPQPGIQPRTSDPSSSPCPTVTEKTSESGSSRSNTSLSERPIVVFDLETTGLVVVVTTAEKDPAADHWHKRGMTCTSFTSVSFSPPIVSICLQNPSRMHDLLLKTQKFAVHVLAKHQVNYGMVFAQPIPPNGCQFDTVPHYQNKQGVPVVLGCCAVMECTSHSVHTVGDHHVWYGEVQHAHIDDKVTDPMLYHFRSFRSVGDEIFLKSFEDATLPFENWTHEAHLRMAWNYIREHGREEAIPLIKSGIKHYNAQNKDKVKFGYSETITMFYTYIVSDALANTEACSFEDFLMRNGHLLDKSTMYDYYSKDKVMSDQAKKKFILPDKKTLPGM